MNHRSVSKLSQDEGSHQKFSRRDFLKVAAGLFSAFPTNTEWEDLLREFEDHLAAARDQNRTLAPNGRWRRRGLSKLPPEGGRLFLTFDDGPLPCTGKILDQLSKKGQKATFFVLGKNLDNQDLRKIAARAMREGHDIGNHSYSHPNFSNISSACARQEIVSTYALIQELIEEVEADPKCQNRFFRFPYGVAGSRSNHLACQEILDELNYKIAGWDLDTKDWRMKLPWFPKRSAAVLASFNRVRPWDVVLLHDRIRTLECLPAILEALQFYKLASLPLSSYESAAEPLVQTDGLDQHLHSYSTPESGVDDLVNEFSKSLINKPDEATDLGNNLFRIILNDVW